MSQSVKFSKTWKEIPKIEKEVLILDFEGIKYLSFLEINDLLEYLIYFPFSGHRYRIKNSTKIVDFLRSEKFFKKFEEAKNLQSFDMLINDPDRNIRLANEISIDQIFPKTSSLKREEIEKHWRHIIGEDLSKYTFIESYKNKILRIRVQNSVLKIDLRQRKESLKQKLENSLYPRKIQDIQLF